MAKDFYTTGACSSHAHCAVCRDLEGGRWLREQWSQLYGMPTEAPDFACPDGFPWGFAGSPGPRKIPDYVARRIETCRGCENHGAGKCGLYGGASCRWRAYIKLPGAVCPAEPPKWACQKILT